jgi:deazaflavin-dependent oxidoreductase (nitroreductase family)
MALRDQTTRQRRKSGIGITLQRFFMNVHIFFYQRTGGVIGGNLGRPMLLLITIGRKSGQERITPIFYFPYGDRFVLIASNGGAPQHPQWWFNLQAHEQAKVQIGLHIIAVTAQEATGEERQHLWSLITSQYPEFTTYQARTTRKIPVVILTPNPS